MKGKLLNSGNFHPGRSAKPASASGPGDRLSTGSPPGAAAGSSLAGLAGEDRSERSHPDGIVRVSIYLPGRPGSEPFTGNPELVGVGGLVIMLSPFHLYTRGLFRPSLAAGSEQQFIDRR